MRISLEEERDVCIEELTGEQIRQCVFLSRSLSFEFGCSFIFTIDIKMYYIWTNVIIQNNNLYYVYDFEFLEFHNLKRKTLTHSRCVI